MNSTKSEAKLLKEKLFSTAKHGAKTISEEEMKKIEEFSKEYKVFLNASKTERESVSFALEKAKKPDLQNLTNLKNITPVTKYIW